MPNVQTHPIKRISAFRKIAIGTWQTAYDPSMYGTLSIRMEKTLAYIEKLRKETGTKVTITHLVTKAVAIALKATPEANAILRWNSIHLRDQVNISVLVLLENDGKVDLSAARLENVDQMSVVDIAKVLNSKVDKIRKNEDKELEQTRQSMGFIPFIFINAFMKFLSFITYTLNLNLKSLGVPKDAFGGAMVTSIGSIGLDVGYVPLVPYSRVPILVAPGEITDQPVVEDGKVIPGKILNLNATFDHRIVDGAHAASLAKSLRKFFEDPEKYCVEHAKDSEKTE